MRLVRSVARSALGAILLLAARPAWSDVTERASLDSTGALANAINIERFCPTLAADGRFVAFGSDATNLVPGDTNGVSDAFVHDRMTGTTERVSVSSAGCGGGGGQLAAGCAPDVPNYRRYRQRGPRLATAEHLDVPHVGAGLPSLPAERACRVV